MIREQGNLLRFEQLLRQESERVLADLVFQRSPMQSRLLAYLVEREAKNLPAPTQYEIAVDALGKDEDYDLGSDSYPRVQISRLRKNLDEYYTRNLPGDGLRITLHPTAYRLRLVPDTRAADHLPSDVALPAGANGPDTPQAPGEYDAPDAHDPPGAVAGKSRVRRVLPWALVAVLAVALLAGLAAWFWTGMDARRAGPQTPFVALDIQARDSSGDEALVSELESASRQVAEMQLTSSFVSRYSAFPDDDDDKRAAYNLSISIGSDARNKVVALVSLRKPGTRLNYDTTIVYDRDNPDRFLAELEAALVYLTAPSGVIATTELSGVSNPLSSDYICFLSIEDRRSSGTDAARLLEKCLEAYPESPYRAFWYARRAFSALQTQVANGRRPSKNSAAWSDVQRAFEVDEFNAFANFTAAKVELAEGNCSNALAYIERAIERGSSYPALIAAMESDTAQCFDLTKNDAFDIERVRSLALYNPSPDPLLHLYLMTSTLATGDLALAQQIAGRRMIPNPETPVEITSDMLRRALTEKGYAASHRQTLKQHLRIFIWNEKTVDEILDRLEG